MAPQNALTALSGRVRLPCQAAAVLAIALGITLALVEEPVAEIGPVLSIVGFALLVVALVGTFLGPPRGPSRSCSHRRCASAGRR